MYKTNVMGTLNMLGLAKRVGARFLLTSTSEVYGDPLEHPQKESYWGHVNPIGVLILSYLRSIYGPSESLQSYALRYTLLCYNCAGVRSCYDEGKRTAETLTMDYHRGAGVEVNKASVSDYGIQV
jgi:UDP-glucuronate decarboxylase